MSFANWITLIGALAGAVVSVLKALSASQSAADAQGHALMAQAHSEKALDVVERSARA